MIVGLVTCEGFLYNAHSLKEKRAVIQSLLTKSRNKYNLSASEVDYQDQWQRTKFAFVGVSTSRKVLENELAGALSLIDQHPEIERTETLYEWL